MIKTIILDMDGTMFDTEPLWEMAFLKTGQELGYKFTKELHDKTISKRKIKKAYLIIFASLILIFLSFSL